MADIFVSYKKENRSYAERFAKCFADQGFSVWWDDDITPREAWDATIEREIAAAASVVVLWSPLAVLSDWVRNEAHYGHDHGKLVPVLIERCDLPLAFRLTQTVDLCGWEGDGGNRQWRKLLTWVADLKATAGAPGPGLAPVNVFRRTLGQLATGETIVDGAFVNAATPPGTLFQDHAEAPIMRILPHGDFLLGGASGDPDRLNTELPQKRIEIARPFAMSLYPVIQAQYEHYGPPPAAPPAPQKAESGSWFWKRKAPQEATAPPAVAADCAACNVSFDDAVRFADELSRTTGGLYRLPSETEWEYACRAGGRSRYAWGDAVDPSHALYRWDAAQPTGPAAPGRFAPNAFGLYDMHGNVREWTQDVWHENYDIVPLDGSALIEGHSSMRVTRGGGWSDPPSVLRCSARGRATQTIRSDVIGLRVVREL